MLAVHAAILPLDAERPGIADVIECPDDFFEVNVPASDALEIPEALGPVKIHMTSEHAGLGAQIPCGILHVDMENTVGEPPDESDIIHAPRRVFFDVTRA